MDDQTPKLKKRVSFGKAKVRLVFDYYDQDSAQSEDTDEKPSREIAKMIPSHLQKPPKSILKPSTRAASMDSGLNALQRVPRRRSEWEQMDRNFWEPAKCKGKGKKGQGSRENRDSKNDSFKEDGKTDVKQENNGIFSKDEMNMASSKVESEQETAEKPAVKNNEKWGGMTSSYAKGMTSPTFIGIYNGVEADWDQTKHSLTRIGVDVGDHSLQNPREFVAIMNMLLSMEKEKLENQSVRGIEQENIAVDRPTELRDPNNNCIRVGEQKIIPENEKDPVIKEELTSAKLGASHKNEKPASSKEELKKQIKKLKMKGLIPRKKENSSSKIRKERSYSEDNLNYEEHCSFSRFRSRMGMNSSSPKHEREKRRGPNRSESEGNLDYFSKFEVQKTGKREERRSMEDSSFDADLECSSTSTSTSTDSSSTINKDDFYSDNNLDLPRRDSVDGSLRRDRSSSCPRESGHLGEDLQHKSERRTVVKRDSWFLTRKQKMKGELREEKSNLNEGRKVLEGNDKQGGIDSERQFRGEISERKSSGKNSGNTIEKKSSGKISGNTIEKKSSGKISGNTIEKKSSGKISGNTIENKSCVEIQESSKSGSKFEKRSKSPKQKIESKPSPKLDERSKPKDGENRKREGGINSESQLKNNPRIKHPDQVKEDSTSGSELDHKSKSSKPKDHKKTDVPDSKNKQTLLTVSNQSESEREDSGLSTSTSLETINALGNEGCASNIVQNNSERKNKIPGEESKRVSGDVKECRAITEHPKTTKIPDAKIPDAKKLTEDNQVEKTTQVDVEISPPLPKDSVEASEMNKSIGNKENFTSKTERHTKTDENELLVDKKFQNDIRFIDREAKRSLRSEEYLERARKRYRPKRNKPTLALIVMEAISKNPAAGLLLPFSN